MIKLELNVRDALYIADRCPDLYEKIVTALEIALGINKRCTVTITGGMTLDNRIYCIKAIRNYSGWGLKEAKDWSDTLVGGWKYDKFIPASAGTKNSITLSTPEAAQALLRDLTDRGLRGFYLMTQSLAA